MRLGRWKPRLFERFTGRARRVISLALEEAERMNHSAVEAEHILLGIIREGEGVASKVLESLNISPERVRAEIESAIGRGERTPYEEVAFTPRAKKVLELALDEARRLGHNYIGTEHLLLGLIREEAVAARVLEAMGADLERVRAQVVYELGELGNARQGRERVSSISRPASEPVGPRDNVVTCRIDDRDLEAIDALIEAGIRTTRSDAAAWLIRAGVEANRALFEKVRATIAEIRRLREQAQAMTRQLEADTSRIVDETLPQPPPSPEGETPSGGEARPQD